MNVKYKLHRLLHWEYWSTPTIYLPLLPVWLYCAWKAKTLFFFHAANPSIKYGGMAMESKKEIYDLIPENWIPRTVFVSRKNNFNEILLELKSKKITFDKNFTTKRDSSYYCSELVEYILETIDENFRILPIKKKLVKFDQFYLQRDSIEYYPVDIFMNNKNFVHIKSK